MLTFRTEDKVLTILIASLKMPDTILGSLSKVSIFKEQLYIEHQIKKSCQDFN